MRLFGLLFLCLICFELHASNDQDGPGEKIPNTTQKEMKICFIDDDKNLKNFYPIFTFLNVAYSKVTPKEDKDTNTEKSKY